jgi:hypothetical protein
VSADDEESDNHRNMDDDLRNNNAHSKHEEILGSNDSNTEGEKAIYHLNVNRVQRILNQASSPKEIKDDTRINEHEDETERNKRTENLIQARTDALKEAIKREVAKEEKTKDINRKAYDNVADDTKQHLQNFNHGHEVSALHDYGGDMAHRTVLKKANINNQEGQSKASVSINNLVSISS